jgi:hypothetical protein
MTQRFSIRYTPVKGFVLRLFLNLRRWSYVEVGPRAVRVRMSYGFSLVTTRGNVESVSRVAPVPITAGAHGWRGHWLVNGANEPIVSITLRVAGRARVLGFPVRVNQVLVSIDEPEALIAALATPEPS